MYYKYEIKTREKGAYIEILEISFYGNHEIIEREQGLRKVKQNRKGRYTNKDRRKVIYIYKITIINVRLKWFKFFSDINIMQILQKIYKQKYKY